MNCKPKEVIEGFINLRARGATFLAISRELGVSQPTLIAWSRKYHRQIQNLRALQLESLSQDSKVSRELCIRTLGRDLDRVRDELEKRSLADVPTAKLFALAAMLRTEAARVTGPIHFSEEVPDGTNEYDDFANPVVSWES